jgi:hypothetical protein
MYEPGSLHIPDRVNNRSTADFNLRVKAGGWRPQSFDAVLITVDGEPVFRGFVWESEARRIVNVPGSVGQYISVPCVDTHLRADTRRVGETYDGWLAGDIVRDIHAKYMAPEGITLGTVQDGPVVERAVFPYLPFSECMDSLAELAGFYWQIDHSPALHFADRATNAAPWSLSEPGPFGDLSVRNHREGYRNTQYTRANMDLTDVRTDRQRGDGSKRAFPLNYPVGKVPVGITVTYGKYDANGAPVVPAPAPTVRTFGIRDIEPGRDFYWQKDSEFITQDDSSTPLTDRDELAVTYQGLFPIVTMNQNLAEVAARKAAGGGTGVFEEVDHVPNIDTQEAAQQYGDAKLSMYSRLNGEVTFKTSQAGLRAGQLLPVNLPADGAVGDYLITEVTMADEGKTGQYGRWTYTVKAVDGGEVGGWIDFFKRLFQAGKTFVIRENEVLVRMRQVADGLKFSDSMTMTRAAPENRIGYMKIGYSEVG